MLYRYDIDDKLDLSKFKKQAPVYIGKMRELTYEFFLKDYKMVAEIATPDGYSAHTVSLYFFDIKKDKDGDVVSEKVVIPLIDTRFKEMQFIKDLFTIDNYKAYFDSNSVEKTTNTLSMLLRLIHKINNLKAFL